MNGIQTLASAAFLAPAERLATLRREVPGRIVFTTSFGVEDQVITHLIFTASLDIEIVTLDTGRLFPSTYRLWSETEAKYGARIRSYHPDQAALESLVAVAGINGFTRSIEARKGCCTVRKVQPLSRVLEGAAAWVTGLRADQSEDRAAVEFAAWDAEQGLLKIAPLFDWSRRQVADYCAVENVPVNELHARGYLSIGCEPCTRAVAPGEPERSGRWWWETDGARECGLHVAADGRLVRKKVAA